MKPFLRIDENLSLQLARLELAELVFKTIDSQRYYLRRWLPWVDPTQTVEDTKTFIRESMKHNSDGTQLVTFIMAGEEFAGILAIHKFDKSHKKCEIGYWLREDMQGNGIMTKACAALISYTFRIKDINRIEILIAADNEKSLAVPLRLGFKQEGILREAIFINKSFHDLVLLSVLKSEWKL